MIAGNRRRLRYVACVSNYVIKHSGARRIDRQTKGLTDGRTGRQTAGLADRETVERTDERQANGLKEDKLTDGRTIGQT